MKFKKRRAFIVSIIVVLCIMITLNDVLYNYANHGKSELLSINLSGRQRMLSQRVTLKLLLIQDQLKEEDNVEKEIAEIQSLLTDFKEVHDDLQKGNKARNLPAIKSPYIQQLFNQVEPYYKKLYSFADSLINDPKPEKVDFYMNQVLSNQKKYLKIQDVITFKFEEEARTDLGKISFKIFILSVGSVILLLLMIPFVFNPIFKKLQSINEELKESSRKYEKFYHNTPAMMHSIDKNGHIINVSNYWLEKMGYTENEVLGRKSTDFLTPNSQKYASKVVIPSFFKTGGCKNISYELVKKSGEIIHTLLSASSEKDKEGNIIRSHAVITDVTIEKEAEKALRESEEKNKTLLRANPDVIFRLTREGDFIDYHADPETLVLPPEMFNSTNIKDTLNPEHSKECLSLIEKALETGEVMICYHDLIHEGQYYYFEGRIVKNGENEVLNIVRNITTQKKAELVKNISNNIAIKSSEANVSVEKLCKYIHEQVGQIIDVSEFYISQLSDIDTLSFIYMNDSTYEGKVPFSRKLGNGLSEYVIKTGKSLLLKNGETLKFQEKHGLDIYGTPAKTWMGSPLMSSGKPIGVIVCQSYNNANIYDETHLALLTSIGTQVGLWIERQKAENELRVSEEKYRTLFQKINQGLLYTNSQGIIEMVNPEFTNLLGYTKKELIGKLCYDFLVDEENQQFFKKKRENRKNGVSEQYESQLVKKSGERIWVHISASPNYDNEGNYIGIMSMIKDITERKIAEQEIREYAYFYSASMELMGIANTDGYFIKVNALFLSTLGYEEEEILSNPFFSFIHPDDLEVTNKEVQNLTKGIPTTNFMNRYRCKNGSYKWISWATTPDPKTGLLYATGRDITELKETETALKRNEYLLKEAQKNAQLGSWEWDVKANKIKWSDELYHLFETPNTIELTFDNYLSIIHPEDLRLVKDAIKNSFVNKKESMVIHRVKTNQQQEKHIESRANFELDKNGEVTRYYGTCMNVTERLQAEKVKEDFTLQLEQKVIERTHELVKSQEQLKEALSKEKELGELKSSFVSTASHQFRTPMAIIQSNSELLNMITQNCDDQIKLKLERATSRIEKEIKRMTDLMDDVLILGKVTSGATTIVKKPTNILELCDELGEQFNEIQDDGRKIDFKHDGKPKDVNIDVKFISHAIINLLSNAFKYSIKENPKLEVYFKEKHIKISVSDTGLGIPEEEIENLFSPFYRAKNARDIQGTGLGLAITKEYVELNNGTIEVKSQLDKGTTFIITLSYL